MGVGAQAQLSFSSLSEESWNGISQNLFELGQNAFLDIVILVIPSVQHLEETTWLAIVVVNIIATIAHDHFDNIHLVCNVLWKRCARFSSSLRALSRHLAG